MRPLFDILHAEAKVSVMVPNEFLDEFAEFQRRISEMLAERNRKILTERLMREVETFVSDGII